MTLTDAERKEADDCDLDVPCTECEEGHFCSWHPSNDEACDG